MARANFKGRPTHPAKRNNASVLKARNAAGFAKRRAQASKVSKADIYEYQPEKNRRGNVRLALDDDEARGVGYDSEDQDDSEDEGKHRRRPRLVGEGEEDERIGSDEDEEIDSDEAFEESDEERFAEFEFKKKDKKTKKSSAKKSKGSVRFAEVDLNEDEDMGGGSDSRSESGNSEETEEEEEEGDDDEFLDVLDVLDGRGEPDFGDDEGAKSRPHGNSDVESPKRDKKQGLQEDSGEGSEEGSEEEGSEEEENEEESNISGSEDDEADVSALDSLGTFVTSLEVGGKRKAEDDQGQNEESGELPVQVKKKKRILKDRTEGGAENEFGARISGSSKLSLEDLLTPLSGKNDDLVALKKSLKPLASSSNPKNQPLPAPLPTRIQEKLDREAAYEQTKQEVDKWSDTMKRIKEAEHLSFPLQAPKSVKVSNLELTARFKPTTELESSIDRLLKSAKLREEDINKTEDLLMKDLTVEEVAERRAELRRMRELAFRADAKAKRVAKIKSKAYRRIQKKEKAKKLAKLDNETGEAEDNEEERLKAEIDRARERATLKHKNTGKWAKAMKSRGELDVDQRRDLNEMLERGDRLRRRIQGIGSGSEDDDEDLSDEDDVDADNSKIKARAFEELSKLQNDEVGDVNTEMFAKKKAKSVFEMKFMKDAEARKNLEVDREIDEFRRQMGNVPMESDNEVDNEKDETLAPVERVNGRMVFRPGPRASAVLPPPPPSAISETSTLRSHDSASVADSPVLTIHDVPTTSNFQPVPPVPPFSLAEEANPWLIEAESSSSKVARRKNELLVGRDVTRAQKSETALQKHMKKSTASREQENDDAVIELKPDDVLVVSNTKSSGASKPEGIKKKEKKKKLKANKAKESVQADEDDSDMNSELEEQEAALKKGGKKAVFEQRELVARAFAGDNVMRQFEEVKRKEIEADAPQEVDTTLAGWGSWGGTGVKKSAPKPHLVKKVSGIDPKSRSDYGKAHVIISEKRDKKAAKYAVKDLPYPYTSKAQFEARMSAPIGIEWNTRLSFQRNTLPRVVKKMGTVIEPLEKL